MTETPGYADLGSGNYVVGISVFEGSPILVIAEPTPEYVKLAQAGKPCPDTYNSNVNELVVAVRFSSEEAFSKFEELVFKIRKEFFSGGAS